LHQHIVRGRKFLTRLAPFGSKVAMRQWGRPKH